MRTTACFSKWTPDGVNHGFHGWDAPEGAVPGVLSGGESVTPAVTETWLGSREQAERAAAQWAASPYRPAAPACTDFDVIYCEACSLPVGQEAVDRRPHPPVYCSERCRDEADAPHVV